MSNKSGHDIWSAAWQEALRTTSLGWDLAVPIFGAALIGHSLNRRFETGHGMTIVLLLFGVLVGFYNVGRRIQSEIDRDRRRSLNEHRKDEPF